MALMIEFQSLFRGEREHGAPPFGGGNQRRFTAALEFDAEKAGTPEQPPGLVSAIGLFRVKNFTAGTAIVSEGSALAAHDQSQRRQHIRPGDLVAIARRGKTIIVVRPVI